MPLPNVPGTAGRLGAMAMGELNLAADVADVNIRLFHEIGWDLAGGHIETTRIISPSKRAITVKVISEVVTRAAQRAHSPEYMATVRRRKCDKICAALNGLREHAARPDFVVCTYPIHKDINDLLTALTPSETEGNAREILRQVRNTLMNGGWNRYRVAAVRDTVVRILSRLAEAEELLPGTVDEVFDQLDRAGLDPVGAPLPELSDEEANAHAESEVPD